MTTFLKRLLGADKAVAKGTAPVKSSRPAGIGRDNPVTIEDGSENATRRQLVQVLLRDATRKHGIPPAWLDLQMVVVNSRTRGPGMYVRLVLRHWDERFLKFMPAFQAGLQTDILRFEPRAGEWLQGLSWQFEVQAACPYTEMPHKDYWVETAPRRIRTGAAAQQLTSDGDSGSGEDHMAASAHTSDIQIAQPFRESSAKSDLEKLFAIRDQELNRAAADGHAPVGYEKTQPSPL